MKICMVVPNEQVKGGIAAVVNGYRSYEKWGDLQITYVESYQDGSKWQKLLKALKAYQQFRVVLKRNSPELVHIHSSFGPSFYRKMPFINMAVRRKIPVMNHIHGAEFDSFYKTAPAWKKKLVQKVYNKCSLLLALSEEWKENLKQIVPEEKIRILENYCSIPEESFQKKKSRFCFLEKLGKEREDLISRRFWKSPDLESPITILCLQVTEIQKIFYR